MANNLVEYEQPTNVPVPKLQAVGQAGVVFTAVMALLVATGVTVPDNINGSAQTAIGALQILIPAVQALIVFAAGYFKKDKRSPEAVRAIKNNETEEY